MTSMGGVNRLRNERFKCEKCDKAFRDDEVRNSWRCPICGEYILIYAEDEETNTNIVLIRKPASEVEVRDLIYLPGSLTKEPYQVVSVNDLGAKLGIGLKGYGRYKVTPDDTVNCRYGAW
jgi:DNA-directed RNA polymerase subunit RPC12/RpoP